MDRGFDALALNLEGVPRGQLADELHRRLRTALLAGRFAPGMRMPSTRALAVQLGVSRNTLLEVYERLLGETYLSSARGSGTYVSHGLKQVSAVAATSRAAPTPTLQFSVPLVLDEHPGVTIDFRPGQPDLASFPIDEWRRSVLRRLRSSRLPLAGDDQTQGDPHLREQICTYVAASRAVRCDPSCVLVTAGAQQAFSLLSQALVSHRITVAVEEPGYPAAAAIFRAAGAQIASVPVDKEGLCVDRLPAQASVVYVTPSHQFPLGVTMSLERRRALLAWARAHDAWIVEDDYDSEFRFGGRRLESLQGIDHGERVVYVGSFSKVLLPAFRLGYAVVPAPLLERMVAAKWLADRHAPSLPQAVMAEFMQTGAFHRHLRRMQSLYADRHQRLCAALTEIDPCRAYLVPSQAGLHVALLLEDRVDVSRLVERARAQGVGLHDLARFCGNAFKPGVVLGFGNVPTQRIVGGVEVIDRLLSHRPTRRA